MGSNTPRVGINFPGILVETSWDLWMYFAATYWAISPAWNGEWSREQGPWKPWFVAIWGGGIPAQVWVCVRACVVFTFWCDCVHAITLLETPSKMSRQTILNCARTTVRWYQKIELACFEIRRIWTHEAFSISTMQNTCKNEKQLHFSKEWGWKTGLNYAWTTVQQRSFLLLSCPRHAGKPFFFLVLMNTPRNRIIPWVLCNLSQLSWSKTWNGLCWYSLLGKKRKYDFNMETRQKQTQDLHLMVYSLLSASSYMIWLAAKKQKFWAESEIQLQIALLVSHNMNQHVTCSFFVEWWFFPSLSHSLFRSLILSCVSLSLCCSSLSFSPSPLNRVYRKLIVFLHSQHGCSCSPHGGAMFAASRQSGKLVLVELILFLVSCRLVSNCSLQFSEEPCDEPRPFCGEKCQCKRMCFGWK